MTPPPFPPFPAALAPLFDPVRPLGAGGMGAVWLVRDRMLDRLVALKVLQQGGAAERERFLREARTAAKLVHPHIVPIFRADETAETTWFTMGFVDGESLGDRIRERGALPPAEVVRSLREAAWALAYAHARGVVHRDVKPDNLLLDRESGRTLVGDFGIARDVSPEAARLTTDGTVLGTVFYMSPEQAAGDPLDGRSDVYALGVVAFEALSGRLPFDGPPQAVLVAHVTRAAPPLATVAPALPPALCAVVDRCLAKAPAERFESAEALAGALDAALAATQEAERAALVAAPGTVLSEADAMAVWQRAAQLQAEAARRMERTVTLQQGAARTDDAPAPADGYLAHDVEAAAIEAGISRQYVALALAERHAAGSGGPLVVSDAEDRQVTTVLGVTQRAVSVTRVIPGTPKAVLEALGRVAPAAPYHLAVDEVVGGHPLDGGILRFRLPTAAEGARTVTSAVGMLPALCYRAYQIDLKILNVTLASRGTPDRPLTEVVISGDLREGQRKNVRVSRWTTGGVTGTFGVGTGIVAGLLLKSALLALFPAVIAGALGGAAMFGMYRVSYRDALAKLVTELESMLKAVQRSLDEVQLFGTVTSYPLASRREPPPPLAPSPASKLGLIADALDRDRSP